jgi:hypothetical protein
VDIERHLVNVKEKGGRTHWYKISREGISAIEDDAQTNGKRDHIINIIKNGSVVAWQHINKSTNVIEKKKYGAR